MRYNQILKETRYEEEILDFGREMLKEKKNKSE